MKNIFALVVAMFAFANIIQAQTSPSEFANIKIENFGQMDERYYRGAQPEPDDYQSLKDLGVQTVIDLRNDPTDYEKPAVEALGMKYVNIPMSGWKWTKDEHVEQFKRLMNDPTTGVVYVHCKAGKHRAGLIGAIYRFEEYDWDYKKAYKEMKNYDYSSWPVHFNIKRYVKDYAKKKAKRDEMARIAAAKAAEAVVGAN